MGVSIMRRSQFFATGLASAVAFVSLSVQPNQSPAETTSSQAKPPGLQCTPAASSSATPDPFNAALAGKLPEGLLPIDGGVRDSILKSGLPCQEHVNPSVGLEKEGLENLQRGFDFYSWRTFIALNSPADAAIAIEHSLPNTPTRWEDMDNFKQLLDVMLPADKQPPKWPDDKAGMEAERERLVPEQCSDLHKQMPDRRMIVQMIEESFNEPFKTGPLIDQQGHYAIFDILMNRQMFKYIKDHQLYTKAGQMSAANSGLLVDFPPGIDHPPGSDPTPTLGAFMLKVSWKILTPEEIATKTFHTVNALVLMPVDPRLPPADREAKRPCLPETLGLIGFHAVHKTLGRPQWIWTSFEHRKNVPDRDQAAARAFEGPYSFFDAGCKDKCPDENATPPRQVWQPDYALQLSFKDDKFRSQIVRETPLTNAAKNMNSIFQSMLHGTVWEYYMLISTQWPTVFFTGCTGLHSPDAAAPAPNTDFLKQPDMTCSPAPSFMANSTLETYSQGDIPQASSSCIGCHGNAVGFQVGASHPTPGQVKLNQSDFTFMLEKAQ
jgi:hypothetical protein